MDILTETEENDHIPRLGHTESHNDGQLLLQAENSNQFVSLNLLQL